MIAGEAYVCRSCRHKPKGKMLFTVFWTDNEEPPEVTRCPRCGRLASTPDVIPRSEWDE